MKITTLCYIENNNQYLMLHRVKKQNDINQGKWIGVGGHAEGIESPEECLVREVKEETGDVYKRQVYSCRRDRFCPDQTVSRYTERQRPV